MSEQCGPMAGVVPIESTCQPIAPANRRYGSTNCAAIGDERHSGKARRGEGRKPNHFCRARQKTRRPLSGAFVVFGREAAGYSLFAFNFEIDHLARRRVYRKTELSDWRLNGNKNTQLRRSSQLAQGYLATIVNGKYIVRSRGDRDWVRKAVFTREP